MKQKAIEIGNSILILFMNHWVVVSLAMFFMSLGGFETPYFGLWAFLFVLPVFLYFVRSYIHNFYLFFLIHIGLMIGVCSLPINIALKIVMAVMFLFYVALSIKTRLSNAAEEVVFVPAASVGIIGAVYIFHDFLIRKDWGIYYILSLLLYLTGFFFYFFMSQYISFVSVNQNSASNIPEREIFLSGIKQTGIYVAGGIFLLLLGANMEWLGYLLGILKAGLAAVLRFLFSFIEYEAPEMNTMPREDGKGPDFGAFMEPGEPHPFWEFLGNVTMILVFAGLAVLLVVLVVKGYQYLKKCFYAPKKPKEEKVKVNQDIRENIQMEGRENRTLNLFSFLDNKERVRKIYRKRILKSKSSIIGDLNTNELQYFTAKECCDKISAQNLKQIYEKARYSGEEITFDEVKMAKVEGERVC